MLPLLLNCTLKGTLLLVAFVLMGLRRQMSAAPRHLFWCCTLAGLLVLPALSMVLPAWHVLPRWAAPEVAAVTVVRVELPRVIPGVESVVPAVVDAPAMEPAPAPAVSVEPRPLAPVTPEKPVRVIEQPSFQWSAWQTLLLWVYVAGAVVALLPMVVAYLMLARLARREVHAAFGDWLPLLDELRARLGVARSVRLVASDSQAMPMTWGLWRAVILLPASAAQWPEERRRCVLLHELAHIRRRDALSFLLARLACAMYWFHPLAWLAAARLRAASELACDDMVLAAGTKSSTYAAELVTLAETSAAPKVAPYAAIAMARTNKPSQLHTRIKAILDPSRRRTRLTVKLVAVTALLAVGLLLPLACMKGGPATAQNPPATTKASQDLLGDLNKPTVLIKLVDEAHRPLGKTSATLYPLTVGPDLSPDDKVLYPDAAGEVEVPLAEAMRHGYVVYPEALRPTFLYLNPPHARPEDKVIFSQVGATRSDLNVEATLQRGRVVGDVGGGRETVIVRITNNGDSPYELTPNDLQLVTMTHRIFAPKDVAKGTVPPRGKGPLELRLDWETYKTRGNWVKVHWNGSWPGPSGPTADGMENYRVKVGSSHSVPVQLPDPIETSWGRAAGGLQLRLRERPSTSTLGQLLATTPTFSLDVRNAGKAAVEVNALPYTYELEFDGKIYHSQIQAVGRLKSLAVNEIVTMDFPLRNTWSKEFPPIAPGKHTLCAALLLGGQRGQSFYVYSNLATFEVAANESGWSEAVTKLQKAVGGTWEADMMNLLPMSDKILRGRIYSEPGKVKVAYDVFPFGLDKFQQLLVESHNTYPAGGKVVAAGDSMTLVELMRDNAKPEPFETFDTINVLALERVTALAPANIPEKWSETTRVLYEESGIFSGHNSFKVDGKGVATLTRDMVGRGDAEIPAGTYETVLPAEDLQRLAGLLRKHTFGERKREMVATDQTLTNVVVIVGNAMASVCFETPDEAREPALAEFRAEMRTLMLKVVKASGPPGSKPAAAAAAAGEPWGDAVAGFQLRLTPGASIWNVRDIEIRKAATRVKLFADAKPVLSLDVRNVGKDAQMISAVAYTYELELDRNVFQSVIEVDSLDKNVVAGESLTMDFPLEPFQLPVPLPRPVPQTRPVRPPLAPGKHTVRAVFRMRDGTAFSNPVTIEVAADGAAGAGAVPAVANAGEIALPIGKESFGGLRIEPYPADKAKDGLLAIGLYSRTRVPPFPNLYDQAINGKIPRGDTEVIARLSDQYTPLKIMRYGIKGHEITIEVALSPKKPDQSSYLWGELPNDLKPGWYHITLMAYEVEEKDGKLVPAPKTTIRAFGQMEAYFSVLQDPAAEQAWHSEAKIIEKAIDDLQERLIQLQKTFPINVPEKNFPIQMPAIEGSAARTAVGDMMFKGFTTGSFPGSGQSVYVWALRDDPAYKFSDFARVHGPVTWDGKTESRNYAFNDAEFGWKVRTRVTGTADFAKQVNGIIDEALTQLAQKLTPVAAPAPAANAAPAQSRTISHLQVRRILPAEDKTTPADEFDDAANAGRKVRLAKEVMLDEKVLEAVEVHDRTGDVTEMGIWFLRRAAPAVIAAERAGGPDFRVAVVIDGKLLPLDKTKLFTQANGPYANVFVHYDAKEKPAVVRIADALNELSFQRPGIVVRGQLFDKPGGKPVAGVHVTLARAMSNPSQTVTTDEQGKFIFKNVPSSSTSYFFQFDDQTPGDIDSVSVSDAQAFSPMEVTLYQELLSITGRVIDIATREPIPGVMIEAGGRPDSAATSDKDGRYVLHVKPREVRINTRGTEDRYRELPTGRVVTTVPGKNLENIDLELTSAPAVEIAVLAPDGKPAANAALTATVTWARAEFITSSTNTGPQQIARPLKTDAQGKATVYLRFPGYTNEERGRVIDIELRALSADRAAGGGASLRTSPETPPKEPMQLRLLQAASVEFTMTGPDGKAVADAKPVVFTPIGYPTFLRSTLEDPMIVSYYYAKYFDPATMSAEVQNRGNGQYAAQGLIPGVEYRISLGLPPADKPSIAVAARPGEKIIGKTLQLIAMPATVPATRLTPRE